MILLDTSGLLSALDESQSYHKQCRDILLSASPPLVLSPFVLAELDYLLMRHLGHAAPAALLKEVAKGAFKLESFAPEDIERCRQIMDHYADLDIGLADASIVVLAERYSHHNILTLDQRHFRALRAERRKRFRILPFDASGTKG